MREENTEENTRNSKTVGIPKKKGNIAGYAQAKRRNIFKPKAIGNRKSFVFQRCAKSCVDLHLEKGRSRGREWGERKREREYIYGPDKLHNFPGSVQ